jgi:predicted XRE-type DNA-binding protein
MNTKNKISENTQKPVVMVKKPELKQTIQDLKGQDVNIMAVNELDGVIKPQDSSTIKYLSNVKDPDTGKVSAPFTIADKKYQMVRGISPSKEIVMGVYCFEETDDMGNNKIYSVEEFESSIARPMLESEKLTMESESKTTQPESLNLGEFKHFIVNEKTGKFKKFKTIPELAATTMLEDEKYMGLQEFKKFFESRVFGVNNNRKKDLAEVGISGDENESDLTVKAQKLMGLIQKKISPNVIDSIKTNKLAQREVIASFAELIGVPRSGLSSLLQGLKDLAKSGGQQQQQAVTENKVIKTIKKKDIK